MSNHAFSVGSSRRINSKLQKRRLPVTAREAILGRCAMEALEQRQLLSFSIPIYNSDFEMPTWVESGSSWVQQAVAPGTQALNYNELDPRFGPPGWAKTAQGGGGPGPNGEGLYNEHNDAGVGQYFNYVNGSLPAPASGTNFFNLEPAPGGTYHFDVDQQPNTTVDAGNHGDINYPPMITATTAVAGETYQATVAFGNPLVNSGAENPGAELDLTLGAGTYYEPSGINSYNYATGQTNSPAQGDTSLDYNGYGTTVASAFTSGSSWNLARGTFQDLSVSWTCPPQDAGMPLDIQVLYAGVSNDSAFDNVRLNDITSPPSAPTNLVVAGSSSSTINVNWTNNASNVGGYQLDQSTTSNFSSGVTTITLGPSTNYYQATGLSANTTYYYRVRTTNLAGTSSNTATMSATTGTSGGTPSSITVPDGNFASDSATYYINNNSGGGTYTSPLTGTLSGWSLSAAPSQNLGGGYTWAPVAGVDNVTSSGASPWSNNAPYIGNQPASSYNSLIYYPGEQYASNNAVSTVQTGASFTATSTGITATATTGTLYTATIDYSNVSWSSAAANPSANLTLNVLANGVEVSSSHLNGLAQGAPWTALSCGWICPSANAGQVIQMQVVASNFLEGPAQWDVPTFALAAATLTGTPSQSGSAPNAPSGLTATAVSSSQINLSWTDNSNNETGFKIDQATNSSFTQNLTTVTVGVNVTTYSATGLASGTTYYYRVRATNGNGDSANTSTASATTSVTVPAAPSGLTATAVSSSQINLAWTDNSNNETGFKIDQATNSGFTTGLTTVTVGANVTTYSATGLSASTTYYYRVRSTNSAGDSANTSTASATTQANSNGSITVPDGNFTDTPGNVINTNTGGGLTFTSPMTGTLSGWNLVATPSTANGGTYSGWEPYGVLDSVTSGSSSSPFSSNVVYIGNEPASTYNAFIYYPGELYNNGSVVGGVQPGAGLTMTTTGISATAVAGMTYTATIEYSNASWSNCAVNPSANVTLNILVNGVVAGTGTLGGLAQNSPWTNVTANWTAGSASAGQAIQLQVVANNFLEGPSSTQQWQVPDFAFTNTTLSSATATGPTAPSGLTASAASSSQINLTWTDNSNNETGFKIDRSTNANFSQNLTTATVAANTTTYSATGLSGTTTYYFRVRATNASGDSASTMTASATTLSSGIIVVPDGNFTDSPANVINSNTGGGLTFTSPMTGTLSGWSISATPSTANGGLYSGWEPYGVLDSVTSGSSSSPYNSNVAWIGNQPASSYNAFIYYPGELYNYGSVVGGAQPAAGLTMTTTGINAAAVAGMIYTATIEYSNVSWSNCAVNPSANVTLNILANGVIVGTSTVSGLSQNSPWSTVTATWPATGANAGQAIQLQVVANNFLEGPGSTQQWQVPTIGFTNATLSAASPVSVTVPDGNFTDTPGNVINTNTGGGLTFTSPMTGNLSGWTISASPSTANGGTYSGWEPYGVLDNVIGGSQSTPFSSNVVYIPNQPASNYNAFIYYPGELYNQGSVVGGAQPGASLSMKTTGISATAVTGTTYTATIEYANVSWSNCAVNPSANVTLNILANGVVVGTSTVTGLAQNSPWTPVTAAWTGTSAKAGQAIQIQVVANNFLEGPSSVQQWQVPTIGFTNATLTTTTAATGLLSVNRPATASSVSGSNVASNAVDGNLNTAWTSNPTNNQWIYIDLGAVMSITEVKLYWAAAYGSSFQIQVSNDLTTWSTIYSTTTGTGGTQDLTGLSGSGRYVRMLGIQSATSNGYSLWDFQVFGI
jgi:phosphodiesterase/alkaline phosphatase D-like protein